MIVHYSDLITRGHIEPLVILACNDSSVKVIADNGRQIYQATFDAAPTCITLVKEEDLKTDE
jgi:hypothetical protein